MQHGMHDKYGVWYSHGLSKRRDAEPPSWFRSEPIGRLLLRPPALHCYLTKAAGGFSVVPQGCDQQCVGVFYCCIPLPSRQPHAATIRLTQEGFAPCLSPVSSQDPWIGRPRAQRKRRVQYPIPGVCRLRCTDTYLTSIRRSARCWAARRDCINQSTLIQRFQIAASCRPNNPIPFNLRQESGSWTTELLSA